MGMRDPYNAWTAANPSQAKVAAPFTKRVQNMNTPYLTRHSAMAALLWPPNIPCSILFGQLADMQARFTYPLAFFWSPM